MSRVSARRRLARITAATGVTALLSASLIATAAAPASAAPVTTTTTYSYTGSTASFVVPAGVTAISLSMLGGLGGNGGADATPAPELGSYRGVVTGSVAVTPGQTITIAVGSGGTTGTSSTSGATAAPAGGNNPLAGFDGGPGGRTGTRGSSGQGGAGGAASVVVIGSDQIVAAGGGGNGGSGQFAPTRGRNADGTYVARADTTSTNGQTGINAYDRCAQVTCSNDDGGGSGGGGGGAQGGAQGQIEFGAGTSNEWFGYGGSVGQNSTAGRSGLTTSYQYVAANGTNGSITISYETGAPSAPSAVRGVAGISSVALEWNPPASAGGAPVSDYAVQYSSDNGSTWSASTLVGAARTNATVSGLTNGTAYVFRVAAVSSEGTGDFSPQSAPITPYALPSAPTLTALAAQDGSLRASFTAPASGAPATGYEYRLDGGAWLPAAGTTSPLAIPGLSNGTTYQVEIRATSSVGAGAASAPLSGTPVAVPGAPTIASATATAGTISLDVTPGFDGGTPVTRYEYRLGSGSWVSAGGTTSPIVISGLDDGTSYSVAVRAVNASGAGIASEAVTVRTPGVPAAPFGVGVTPGDGTLTVSYSVGDSGGSPIERVQYRVGGGSWSDVPHTGPFVIEGLTNGTSYWVELRAINAIGTGATSPAGSGTPRGLASAPTIDAVSATDPVTLSVDFTAPTSTGGSAILGYEYSTDGGATWRARDDGDSTASPLSLTTLSSDGTTPLDSGRTYPIEIRAVTAVGAGAASAVVDGVPVDVPAAPSIDAVTPRSGAVAVTFTPGSNGGRAITAYEYSVNGGSWSSTGSLSTSFVISGLTDGVAASVRVRAVSSVGTGTASAPVSATPASAPQQPTVTSVVRSDRTLTASITPGADGGSAVTSWQYSTDGGATWATASGTSLPLDITSPSADTGVRLVNGQGYSLQVRAVNAAGVSPESNIVTVAPASAPPRPSVSVTAGDSSVSVSYALSGDGGSPVTRMEYSLDGDTWIDTATLSSPFALTGLTNGTEVSVQVRAINAIGTGQASTVAKATPRTVPGAPTAVSAASNTGSLTVSWTAPASTGGSAVTGYTARAYTDATATTVIASCTTATTSCTITGLTNGTSYYVDVTATNVAGSGPASAPRTTGTPLVRPSAPTITSVAAGDQRLSVAFTAGAAGDRTITRYQYTTDDGATWVDALGTSSPIVLTGLTNGTTYSVKLRAVSAAGVGAASNAGSGKPVGYPSVPGNITATGASGSIVVNWTPADANGGVIQSYTATAFNAAAGGSTVQSCTTSTGTATTCTITGLSNGTTYYISVQTLTTGGLYSERSDPRVAVAPGTVPGAPTAVGAIAGNGSATVSWSAPASAGSTAISGYQVFCSAGGGSFVACGTATGTSTTVTGLTNGVSYTFRVAARNASGYGAQSASSNAVTPAAPGIAPTFGTPSRTATGYTAGITNYDSASTYTVSVTAGTATVSGGTVTVTGLNPGQSATATVTVAHDGRADASGTVTSSALAAGVAPQFTAVTRTVDGFTATIQNLDAGASYTVTSSAGLAVRSGATITVTGLEPGQSATVTVAVAKAGSTDAENTLTRSALDEGIAPEFANLTRTVDGFTVEIDNLDDDGTYTASSTSGTATVSAGVVTVSGLEPGESATVTVSVAKTGSTDASASTLGRALASGTAPDLGTVTRTADGFTVTVDDLDADADYAVTSTAGTATIVDGVVTVTGLEPGQSAWVTVTVTRAGQAPAHASALAFALAAGVAPDLGEVTRTIDGFTVPIENVDPGATYTVTSTAGAATVIDGVVVVTGLEPGGSASVTVTASTEGSTDADASATGTALDAGVKPEFGDLTRTEDGFMAPIENVDADATYVVSSSAGTATIVDGVVVVTGLEPGGTASVTVTVSKAGSATAAETVSGSALVSGVAPQFGTVTRTVDGFTAAISNVDAGATYTVSTTAGTATVVDGVVIVVGLEPGESAEVTVTVTKAGSTTANAAISGSALASGVAPQLGAPTRTPDGFTVSVSNVDAGATYTVATTAGTATIADGVVTVTGLEPGQSAQVTVTAAKTGATTASASVTAAALVSGAAPQFGAITRTATGFAVQLVDVDPDADYAVSTTAGRVAIIDGLVVVTGLQPGQSARVTVTVSKAGSTTATDAVTASALDAGVAPQLGEPTGTADGFTVPIENVDAGAVYTATSTRGVATVVDGVVVVAGLEPGQSAEVTVSVTKVGSTRASATATGTALVPGTTPETGTVTRTASGFSFTLDDLDPDATYTVTTTAGTAVIIDGRVVVTGLRPGETAVVTVTGTKDGATTTTVTVSGAALERGVRPELGEVTRTADGFTVPITNYDPDVTYTVVSSAGTATIGAGAQLRRAAATAAFGGADIVTVTGLRPGQSALITVTASATGATSAAAGTNGTALDPGIPAEFGKPTVDGDSITVLITDYDPTAEYVVTTTAGTVTRVGAYLIVTGLEPGESAVLSVVVYRDGAVEAESSLTVTAPKSTDPGDGDGDGGNGGTDNGGTDNGGTEGEGQGGTDGGLAGTGGDSSALLLWAALGVLTIGAGGTVIAVGARRRKRAEQE
jgi:titin